MSVRESLGSLAPRKKLNKVIIGHFGKSYGIKGWLKVKSLHRPLADFLKFSMIWVYHQDNWENIQITEGKNLGPSFVVKIAGCDTPEVAKTYANDPIAVLREQLPSLPEGEYYWDDLLGLQVFNQDQVLLGTIDHLLETGANDVMVLKSNKKRLIPYTRNVVKSIDLSSKIMVVDWPTDF